MAPPRVLSMRVIKIFTPRRVEGRKCVGKKESGGKNLNQVINKVDNGNTPNGQIFIYVCFFILMTSYV